MLKPLILAITLAAAAAITAHAEAPLWTVQQFRDSIGVNIHVGHPHPNPTYYDEPQTIIDALRYVGVTHVRTKDDTANLASYRALNAAHIKLDLIHHMVAGMADEIALGAEGVEMVEGPNEVNRWGAGFRYHGQTGLPATLALMGDISTEFRAWVAGLPHGAPVPMLIAWSQSIGIPTWGGDISALVDCGNVHDYVRGGAPPWVGRDAIHEQSGVSAPGRCMTITETGYYTRPVAVPAKGLPSGVSEHVQAILTIDALFDTHRMGAFRSYPYQLFDVVDPASAPCDPDTVPTPHFPECYFGWYRYGGAAGPAPKPAAIAMHNLTTILAEHAPPPAHPTALPVTWSGLAPTHATLQLAAADGSTWLLLWNEPLDPAGLWDWRNQVERALPPATVTASFTDAHAYEVFDPVESLTPLQGAKGATVTLSLSADPLMVHVRR